MSAAVDINVLYENLEEMGVEVFDCPLSQFSAVAEPAGYLGLNPSQISSVEQEREILIHEEGHFATNTFYQLDSPLHRAPASGKSCRAPWHQEVFFRRKAFKSHGAGLYRKLAAGRAAWRPPRLYTGNAGLLHAGAGRQFLLGTEEAPSRAGNTGGAGGRPAYRGYPPRIVAVYRH